MTIKSALARLAGVSTSMPPEPDARILVPRTGSVIRPRGPRLTGGISLGRLGERDAEVILDRGIVRELVILTGDPARHPQKQ